MKYLNIWFLSLGLTLSTVGNAQQHIENRSLSICYNKTTSIIFPFSITSVDRGSNDLIAQKANGVENVLQLKAGRKEFTETNLTVITADGVLHQFTVSYADAPASQAIMVASSDGQSSLILAKDVINEYRIQADSRQVLNHTKRGKVQRDNKHQLSLTLQDVFIRDNTMYYQVAIRNRSAINYDIKSLKFIIKDKREVKRTSSQEIEVAPLYVGNETENIKGYASKSMIYAVKKFTIPDGKILRINLFEQNGGRNLSLKVKNRDILKARMLTATENLLTIN